MRGAPQVSVAVASNLLSKVSELQTQTPHTLHSVFTQVQPKHLSKGQTAQTPVCTPDAPGYTDKVHSSESFIISPVFQDSERGERRVINADVEFFSHRWLQVSRRRQTVLHWIYSGQWRT
ncbi:hypothetical protein GDO81_020781 [Engystomops pustulosus]|uniref:Uncharacterized protein n=1 Tax=Engystomops pustulosus TaxID=76066 RepID=A0AAV6YUN7_ENGPU|nr:hypothetical protein GDO81_020781 [Engystomops pustulosus]